MKIAILINLLFLSIHHKADVTTHFINADISRYAIFKLDDNPSAFDKNTKPTSLSKQEIEQIEMLIKTTAKQYNRRNTILGQIKRPSRYYKQVIPIINSKGEKEVWINCLCSVDGTPDWKTRILLVLDGGSCYFQLKINLTKNTVYDFGVNGVA